jgi:hypothetical protein
VNGTIQNLVRKNGDKDHRFGIPGQWERAAATLAVAANGRALKLSAHKSTL